MNFAIKEYKIMALAANVVAGELVPMIKLSISISKFSEIFSYISKKEHFKSFSFSFPSHLIVKGPKRYFCKSPGYKA